MRGGSQVSMVGNVGEPIKYSWTGEGKDAGTFMLCLDEGMGSVTWIKVNVYDGNAEICKLKLRKGMRVTVFGTLMNRSTNTGTSVEVRCSNIIFERDHKS